MHIMVLFMLFSYSFHHSFVDNVCRDSVFCSGWHMHHSTYWTAAVLQMDIKITGYFTIMEATDRTICFSSRKFDAS